MLECFVRRNTKTPSALDPLSPQYKPPTGVVTSPAIEAHMAKEHAKEAAAMDTRAVASKQKENVRNRPDPKQLPTGTFSSATRPASIVSAQASTSASIPTHPPSRSFTLPKNPAEQIAMLNECMKVNFSLDVKANKNVALQVLPKGFTSPVRPPLNLSLGITGWPTQAKKFPEALQPFEPTKNTEHSGISFISSSESCRG